MKKKINILFLLIVSVFLSYNMQKKTYAVPISPDKYFINIHPGETKTEELIIMGRKEMTGPVTLYLRPVGMKKVGEAHDRSFYMPDPNDQSEPANWVHLSQTTVTIHPGETLRVKWSITPSDVAQCGTNLAAILISTKDYNENNKKKSPTEVELNKEVASQIHVTINTNGKCNNKIHLQLLDFKVIKQKILGLVSLPIYNYNNAQFETRVANDGNLIARSPMGFITIQGPNIKKVQVPLNPDHYDIYPQTTRKFITTWHDENYPDAGGFFKKLFYEITHWRFGRYSATLGITKNTDTNIITTVTFLIIPWRPFLTILVLIAGLFVYFKVKNKQNEK